jgi:hypothetical protein
MYGSIMIIGFISGFVIAMVIDKFSETLAKIIVEL